ncbi:class I SAM-dependent methyltransferase [Paenibacillus albiflavus]|uniref:Class I SAM-dependent methyltransferase n=1 Tax=Paenibacillus albiflavus TaxID=2545760 RepID=A0A4R4EKP9_9BACL|nr:class I SAM-dependent methyltransferase [Paenibacillus albiflavus]TCZ80053.1 class I SAM-dependent methyltransferase [Paenibacillus albiflavus]
MTDPKVNVNEIKQAVKDQFSKNANKYVTSESHAKSDDLPLLTTWLDPQSNWIVLDVATGGGHVTKQLAPYVDYVLATDLTHEMLHAARQFISQSADNVNYVVADAESLPFLDQSFDAITCRIAAHHFPNPNRFILEAVRVLKPNGKLLLIDNIASENKSFDHFVNKLEHLRDRSHVRCYTLSEWSTWINAAGFEEMNSRIRKKTLLFPSWVERTTESDEQIDEVKQHLLQASPEIHNYIKLVKVADEIVSFAIDEWMVLLKKTS